MSALRHRRDERGASLVLMLLVIVATISVAALVVDLGALRNRRQNQRVNADAAALAGAELLRNGNASSACAMAWNYVKTNAAIADSAVTTAPNCSVLATTCTATTARTTTAAWTGGSLIFTSPVPDNSPLLGGQAITSRDGSPCGRFGVQITTTRGNLIRNDSTSVTTSAVGAHTDGGTVTAPLIVLDPHVCKALWMRSTSNLDAESGLTTPGRIIIDSDGAACQADRVLSLDNASAIVADGTDYGLAGQVSMYALTTNPTKAYSSNDVSTAPGGHGVWPVPVAASAPTGRTAIDARYNCNVALGCTGTPVIAPLVTALGGTGTPTGYTAWSYGCTPSGVIPTGNYYVSSSVCPNGLNVASNTVLLFGPGTNLVMDKGFVNGSNSRVSFNCSTNDWTTCNHNPSTNGMMFIRSGAIFCQDGNYDFWGTFIYAVGTGGTCAGGIWEMGGQRELNWTAPETGDFEDLLMWTEAAVDMTLRSNVSMMLEGTLFAPNTRFHMENSNISTTQHAQIFTNTVYMEGGSALRLEPYNDRSTLVNTHAGNGTSIVR